MKALMNTTYYISFGLIIVLIIIMLLTIFPIPGTNFDLRVVQSGSMEPAIKMGSVVFIRPTDSIESGDIITYRRPGQDTPTTHRVIKISTENSQTLYTTKGDANEVRDMESVTENMILGQVSLTVPYVGHGINSARTPVGFALLIIVPALLIGFDEIKKIVQTLQKRQTNSD